jgi:hypothetical protein
MFAGGLTFSEESWSIDGLGIRGMKFIPSAGLSGLIYDQGSVNSCGLSPVGKFNFFTNRMDEKAKFISHYQSNLHEDWMDILLPFELRNRQSKRPVAQVFLAAIIRSARDGGHSYVDNFSINDNMESYLKTQPVRALSNGVSTLYNTSFIGSESIETSTFTKNSGQRSKYIYGSVVFPVNNNLKTSLQAYYSKINGKVDVYENRLFNYMNNPDFSHEYFTGKATLEHMFLNTGEQSLSYRLEAGYDNSWSHQGNDRFGEDFFRYNYIGAYIRHYQPGYDYSINSGVDTYTMNGINTTSVDFIPGSLNPGLARYVELMKEFSDFFMFDDYYLNGYLPENTYAGWSNYDVPVRTYGKSNSRRGYITGSLDWKNKIGHFNAGFDYKNTLYRSYSLNTNYIWLAPRSMVNSHLRLDTDNPQISVIDGDTYINYGDRADLDKQSDFDRNLRIRMGLDPDGTEQILFNSYNYEQGTISYYTPDRQLVSMQVGTDFLDVSLFSPEEFLPMSEISGYDCQGRKVSHSHDPYSFMADGAQLPYAPVNLAFWLDYKKELKNFNIEAGIRTELFDARQPVLSDPLSLWRIATVGETPQLDHAGGIGKDWLVYLDPESADLTDLGFYRSGENWYDIKGNPITNLQQIHIVRPLLATASGEGMYGMNFIDYKPKVSLLPFLKLKYVLSPFAFLVFEHKSFTRNPYFNRFTAKEYYTWQSRSNPVLENPGLKPERFDFSNLGIGFTIPGGSILIRAERNVFSRLIQAKFWEKAFPKSYFSYVNTDARITVPALSIESVFRKYWWEAGGHFTHHFMNNNLKINDAIDKYTLPVFLSTISNVGTFYSALKCHGILEGLSLSVVYHFRGRLPYYVNTFGYIPHEAETFDPVHTFDSKLNYSFEWQDIRFGLFVNICNIFNSRTLYFVYPATGKPDDDGYLKAAEYQATINSQADPQAFRDQYSIFINKPAYYGQPRIVQFGLNLDFNLSPDIE